MKTALLAAASALLLTLHHAAFAAVCTQDQVAAIDALEKKTLASDACKGFVSIRVCADDMCLAALDAMRGDPLAFPICRVGGVARSFQWLDYTSACQVGLPVPDSVTGDAAMGTVAADAIDSSSSGSSVSDFDSVLWATTTTPTPTIASSSDGGECTIEQLSDIATLALNLSMDPGCSQALTTAKTLGDAACASTACMDAVRKIAAQIPNCTVQGEDAKAQYTSAIPDCSKSVAASGAAWSPALFMPAVLSCIAVVMYVV